MSTTATTPHPDVPLPAGAISADDWDGDGDEFDVRVFRGPEYIVFNGASEVIAEVEARGGQYPDGSIDDEVDPPAIYICLDADYGITSSEARELAHTLVEAADELESPADVLQLTSSAMLAYPDCA
jgi:hypothetical protein